MFVVEALTKLATAGVDQFEWNQIYRSIRLNEMQRWIGYTNLFDDLLGRWRRRRTHLSCFFWVLTNEI